MLDTYKIKFDPLFAYEVIALGGVIALVILCFSFRFERRPLFFRSILIILLAFIALNPMIEKSEFKIQSTSVLILTDHSQSMSLFNRTADAEKLKADLISSIQESSKQAVIIEDIFNRDENGSNTPQKSLNTTLLRYRGQPIGAVYLISDGGLYDIDEDFTSPLGNVPIHSLLVGNEAPFDLRPEIIAAPSFSVVNEPITIKAEVIAEGIYAPNLQVEMTVRIGEDILFNGFAPINTPLEFDYESYKAGKSHIEIQIGAVKEELTPTNNTLTKEISIVRQRLRVLLVSGRPYPGQRTWRDLLKSDPNVDLVHFTILRTPFKQDATPVSELALIPFPTKELFVDQIDSFDLIIFDRYTRSGILQLQYFAAIRDRILNGGALLTIAGPGFESGTSLANSFIGDILPGYPTGIITQSPYRPQITDLGKRHPIFNQLSAYNPSFITQDPKWGHWSRLIHTQETEGTTLMRAPTGEPLLMATRAQNGRVVQLNSDHIWLWARGFDGGGPYELFVKNIIHWLLKHPELEEEELELALENDQLLIKRQTLSSTADNLFIQYDDGEKIPLNLEFQKAGIWQANYQLEREGRYSVYSGALSKSIWYGKGNQKEFHHLHTSDQFVSSIAKETNAGVFTKLPQIRELPASMRSFSGKNWSGIKENNHKIETGKDITHLIQGLLIALILMVITALVWVGERRQTFRK